MQEVREMWDTFQQEIHQFFYDHQHLNESQLLKTLLCQLDLQQTVCVDVNQPSISKLINLALEKKMKKTVVRRRLLHCMCIKNPHLKSYCSRIQYVPCIREMEMEFCRSGSSSSLEMIIQQVKQECREPIEERYLGEVQWHLFYDLMSRVMRNDGEWIQTRTLQDSHVSFVCELNLHLSNPHVPFGPKNIWLELTHETRKHMLFLFPLKQGKKRFLWKETWYTVSNEKAFGVNSLRPEYVIGEDQDKDQDKDRYTWSYHWSDPFCFFSVIKTFLSQVINIHCVRVVIQDYCF
jgi:hypothetical protein